MGIRAARRCSGPRGFSLIELTVVLSVSIVLTGLLLPVLSNVRENVHRVISSSNMRQIGLAIVMYERDQGTIPYSQVLEDGMPQELMVVHLEEPDQWDGLGLLYAYKYCSAASVFYNPSHFGDHRFERYEFDWQSPDEKHIYSNYHYAGHKDWQTGRPRRLGQGSDLVLATDGLRTFSDFSHRTGMNILRGDGSVRWRDDDGTIATALPMVASPVTDDYRGLWGSIESDDKD